MLRRVRQQAFWALTSGSRSKAPTCLKNEPFDDIPFKYDNRQCWHFKLTQIWILPFMFRGVQYTVHTAAIYPPKWLTMGKSYFPVPLPDEQD